MTVQRLMKPTSNDKNQTKRENYGYLLLPFAKKYYHISTTSL